MALNLSRVHPKLRTIARNLPRVAASQGFQVRVTSGWRSRATQAKLYNDYIQGKSLYPANYPGTSAHEKGLALDILSTNTAALVGLLASVGLQWAGPGDDIHFQMAVGSPRTAVLAPAKAIPQPKKKSLAKKVLGVAGWVPGPVGWGASLLDLIF